MSSGPPLLVRRCDECDGRFLPRPGPCPRCGALALVDHWVPGTGVVLAATALESPPAGYAAPHRLALVELAEGARVVALAPLRLPRRGAWVQVVQDGEEYRIVRETGEPAAEGRGEGESPSVEETRRSFEPPR